MARSSATEATSTEFATCETGIVAGLLFFLAHPDDETFIAGGTIAKYAAVGVEIGVVCATRGERGKTGDICSRDDLAGIREAELRDAAQILGIRYLEILSYEDQTLAAATPDRDSALHGRCSAAAAAADCGHL